MEIKIKECYRKCLFFRISMDGMECNHPYFKNKECYENMIITHQNIKGKIPEKCPLRNEKLIISL